MVPSPSARSARSGQALRDSVVNTTLPGTYVPGFRIAPLRGWINPAPTALQSLQCFQGSAASAGVRACAATMHTNITFPSRSGLGSQICFRAFSVIVQRERCGERSLGWADRFHCLRVNGWTFETVAGKRFGDELNQTFHRGSWHRKSSWPDPTQAPALRFDESPEGMPGQAKAGGSHRFFHPFRRDGSPQREDPEPPRLRIAPCFLVLAPSCGV